MAQTIWADPNNKGWEGFRFAAYYLDSKRVLDLPLKEKQNTSGEVTETATSVGEVLQKTLDRKVGTGLLLFGLTIKTDAGDLEIDGPTFNLQMLEILLKLRNEGVNPLEADWFWYERSSCLEDPHELYPFFVVYDNKIIREHVSFSDSFHSGFDPSVFVHNDHKSIWSGEKARREANALYWYRRFLAETQTGQIMSLRSDEPRLLRFLAVSQVREAESDSTDDSSSELDLQEKAINLLQSVLVEIVILRWALVVVGILVLVTLWW